MIIKAITGNGFADLAKYTLEKPGRFIGGRPGAWDDLSAEMAHYRGANPVTDPVFHYSLSIAPGEWLTDAQWDQAARALLDHMGMTCNLYRVQMHIDTAHPHVHVIGSRIRADTYHKVSPDFEMRRAFQFARKLERQYGLKYLHGKRKWHNLRTRHGRLRFLIDQVLAKHPDYVRFVQGLRTYGIKVVPNMTGGVVRGISFRYQNRGYKGSSLGRGYSWNRIAPRLGIDPAQGFTPPHVPDKPLRLHHLSPTVLGRPMASSLQAYLHSSLAYYRLLKRIRNAAPTPKQEDNRKDRRHGRSR